MQLKNQYLRSRILVILWLGNFVSDKLVVLVTNLVLFDRSHTNYAFAICAQVVLYNTIALDFDM